MPRKEKSAVDESVKALERAEKKREKAKRDGDKKKRKSHESGRKLRNIAFALIVVLLLGIITSLITFQFFPEMQFLDIPRRAISYVMKPVQEVFSSGTGWFFDYVRRVKIRNNIEYEYEQLYEKYDELLSQVMLVDELQTQINEYQELLSEMQTHSQFDGIAARVIGSDSTNYFSSFTINVGTDHGVDNYMAVVKAGGLVGYTYDVTETTAKVQSVISSETSISALISSSRYQGAVTGTLGIDGTPMCRMYYLNVDHLPRQGDVVVTSGVGVEFPKGIPIGTVRESTRGLDAGKSYVVVEPYVDFERIENVIVYRYQPSYAEKAEVREDDVKREFDQLPTARPVPTFGVSGGMTFGSGTITPTPAVDPVVTETPVSPLDETTPSPSVEPEGNGEADGTTPAPNLSYEDVPGTPTPPPTPTPTPSPTPTPTFSIHDMTVEED